MPTLRELATAALELALRRLEPGALTQQALARWPGGGRVRVLAVGKAALAMARGAAEALADRVEAGLIVTRDGPGEPALPGVPVITAAHPVPDARSESAGRQLLALAGSAPCDLVVLLSGGASALACVPAPGLTLADKIAATSALAASGASIDELNVVRKHLSAIKGGRLAQATSSGRAVHTLVVSDVVSGDLSIIGSGVTVPDPSSYADALAIASRVAIPAAIVRHLTAGVRGELTETPKPGTLPHATAQVLAGPAELASAAAAALRDAGVDVEQRAALVTGDVAAVAAELATVARRLCARATQRRVAWVAAGEPTIALPPGPGRGGRAQQVALLAALAIEDLPGVTILAAASDGSDGPTRDAGGLVDGGPGGTTARVRAAGIAPETAAARADAGTALAAANDLFTSGPTGTNLCDLFVVLAEPARK